MDYKLRPLAISQPAIQFCQQNQKNTNITLTMFTEKPDCELI